MGENLNSENSTVFRLKVWRIEANLTQAQLATLSGLEQTAISDIERGKTKRFKRENVDKLAEAISIKFKEHNRSPISAYQIAEYMWFLESSGASPKKFDLLTDFNRQEALTSICA